MTDPRLTHSTQRITFVQEEIKRLTERLNQFKKSEYINRPDFQSGVKEMRRQLREFKREYSVIIQHKEDKPMPKQTEGQIVMKHLAQEYKMSDTQLRRWFRESGIKHEKGQRYKWEDENAKSLKDFRSYIEKRLAKG